MVNTDYTESPICVKCIITVKVLCFDNTFASVHSKGSYGQTSFCALERAKDLEIEGGGK
jgi:hypothetical protein